MRSTFGIFRVKKFAANIGNSIICFHYYKLFQLQQYLFRIFLNSAKILFLQIGIIYMIFSGKSNWFYILLYVICLHYSYVIITLNNIWLLYFYFVQNNISKLSKQVESDKVKFGWFRGSGLGIYDLPAILNFI